ncbi:hypothetical protein [Endozoicomonas sp. 8E]|uniref:hypothetical protein n=1 Tax=Endozoicomonas sp. 8E TaxID=3035692 RepID=UPI002938DE3F|nr:hypothetical protein [Endozoicomonas sp. 8E]WOG27572.1 hypothetical protein P6910_23995 [Endozoicomonas sp. 8E]
MHFYRLFIAFVLFLLAVAVVPLCYCSTIIDRHHPDGRGVRIEIDDFTDPQGATQWQVVLLLPEGFNDRNSILCFKAPVAPADSDSIVIWVRSDLSDYCYQPVIVREEQIPFFQDVSERASENGTLIRLKSTTADRPELISVTTDQPPNVKPQAIPLTLLVYPGEMTNSGLETGKTRNNTLSSTADKLAGKASFPSGGNGGFFQLPPHPPGGGGRPSGLFEIDLVILKPVINWLMSIGKDSISIEEQPSRARLKMTRVNADGSSSEAVIPVGWLDFLNIEQLTDVYFWNTLLQRAATACPASEGLQWQLGCLKLFLERTALKTDRVGGLKTADGDGEPSGKSPDKAPKDENNDHQKEKKGEPEDQENNSPGEGSKSSGDGDKRKDNNGKKSEKSTSTQNLQELANQLLAIIESDDPDAVFKLRQILDELDLPQRLQVLETKGTNTLGITVTPLEAILQLQRSFDENSTRNQFIKQLIEATSDQTRTLDDFNIPSELQPITPPDRALPEVADNNLMILYKIVLNIIHRVNQSDQQPPIGHFEQCCFTEYFVKLFLLYSNPLESIRELLGKISDPGISRDIMISAQSFTFSISFRDTFIQLNEHPSRRELVRLSNELIKQAHTFDSLQVPSLQAHSLQAYSLQAHSLQAHSLQAHSLQAPFVEPVSSHSDITFNTTTANNGNTLTNSSQPVNSYHSASGSNDSLPGLAADRYLQQGARPKLPSLAGPQNASFQKRSQTRRSHGYHQSSRADDRSDLEELGIDPNFLSKHSTDGSILVELKRRAQEKRKKKTTD